MLDVFITFFCFDINIILNEKNIWIFQYLDIESLIAHFPAAGAENQTSDLQTEGTLSRTL